MTNRVVSDGAGKSTTLLAIAGALPVASGEVVFEGTRITRRSARWRVQQGIALVAEGRQLFPEFTVAQNLRVGYTGPRRPSRSLPDFLAWVFEMFPILQQRRDSPAGALSGGEQQMLAIARALAGEPRLLMLDEPSLGLGPLIVAQVYDVLQRLLAETNLAVLVVEQYVEQALRLTDHTYVINNGAVTLEGSSREIDRDGALAQSYLGDK